jgi:hypothetical protein
MPLQRGEVLGYDFNRMVVEFTMLNQGKTVQCAISTAAMDGLEGKHDVKADQRVDQFVRLRDAIEERASIAQVLRRVSWGRRTDSVVIRRFLQAAARQQPRPVDCHRHVTAPRYTVERLGTSHQPQPRHRSHLTRGASLVRESRRF